MSGGEYHYAYGYAKEMAERLTNNEHPLRVAFGVFLLKVAKAMHDIEWVDSNDYSPGDEMAAIKECVSSNNIDEGLRLYLNRIKASVKVLEVFLDDQAKAKEE